MMIEISHVKSHVLLDSAICTAFNKLLMEFHFHVLCNGMKTFNYFLLPTFSKKPKFTDFFISIQIFICVMYKFSLYAIFAFKLETYNFKAVKGDCCKTKPINEIEFIHYLIL